MQRSGPKLSLGIPVHNGAAYLTELLDCLRAQTFGGYACELLGVEAPPEIPFEDADLSPLARSFYGDNRRVRNARIKEELGVVLRYPSYREGLRAIRDLEASTARRGRATSAIVLEEAP